MIVDLEERRRGRRLRPRDQAINDLMEVHAGLDEIRRALPALEALCSRVAGYLERENAA